MTTKELMYLGLKYQEPPEGYYKDREREYFENAEENR